MSKILGVPKCKPRQAPALEAAPKHREDDYLICVQLMNAYEDIAEFIRLSIPAETVDRIMMGSRLGSEMKYVPHIHHHHPPTSFGYDRFYDYSIDPDFNGPFSLNISPVCASSAIGSVVYCLGGDCNGRVDSDDCHTLRFCDFSHPIPRWNIITKPLPCHRFRPIMMTIDDRLYVLEKRGIFEDKGSESFPLGFFFSPPEECCNKLPFAAFHEVHDLVIASMSRNLLVVDRIIGTQYYFDIYQSSWIRFDVPRLHEHMSGIYGQPISVEENTTLYWLTELGEIGAFNWQSFRMFKGPIIGFGHQDFLDASCSTLKLLHLKGDLFCIVWAGPSDTLHLSVLNISLDNSPNFLSNSSSYLTAFLLACFCYHLDFSVMINAVHLLR